MALNNKRGQANTYQAKAYPQKQQPKLREYYNIFSVLQKGESMKITELQMKNPKGISNILIDLSESNTINDNVQAELLFLSYGMESIIKEIFMTVDNQQ